MSLFLLTILLISILGYSFYFKEKLQTPYSITIPVVTSSILTILFIATILGVLNVITYVVYVAGGMLFIYSMYYAFKHEISLKSYFTPELIALLLVIVVYYIYISPAYYSAWDDFSHYGICTKELYHYNGMLHTPSDQTSILLPLFGYTRISAIFNYFVTKLIGYSEGNSMFATGLLSILLSSAVLVKRSMLKSLMLILGILAAGVLYTPLLRSTYLDGLVGITFGALISIYMQIRNRDKSLVWLLPMFFVLPNIKEVGFWLAYAAAISLTIHLILNGKINRNNIFYIFLFFALPYASHKIWANYLLTFDIISPHSKFNVSEYLHVLKGAFSSQQSLAISTMFLKSVVSFIFKEGSLVLYALCGLLIYLKKKEQLILPSFKSLIYALFLMFVLYLSFRLFLYLKIYSPYEALRSASYVRYYALFAIVFFFVLATYLKFAFEQLKVHDLSIKNNKLVIGLIVIFFSIIAHNLYIRVPNEFNHDRSLSASIAHELGELKKTNFKIMTIYNYVNSFNCAQINYELAPHNAYSDYRTCSDTTFNFWPRPYKLNDGFTIDSNMFNDQTSSEKDHNKYDILYFADIQDNDKEIIQKALDIPEVNSNVFIKKNGKFVSYNTAEVAK